MGKQDAPPSGNDKTSIVILLKHQPGTLSQVIKELVAVEWVPGSTRAAFSSYGSGLNPSDGLAVGQRIEGFDPSPA